MNKNKAALKYLIYICIAGIICVCFLKLEFIREITKVIFISFVVSYSLKAPYEKLIDRGVNKRISAVLLLSIFLGIALIFFIVLIPSLINESDNITNTIQEVQEYIKQSYKKFEFLNDNKFINNFLKNSYVKINNSITNLFENIFDWLMSVGENVFIYAITPIFVYYFLCDKETLKNKLLIILPSKRRKILKKIIEDIDKILSRYIMSQFLLCFFIGIFTFIILKFLNIKFPTVLAILNGVLNIIPYFGPAFGAVPIIFIAVLQSFKTALWAAACLFVIQQVEGDIISPKIIGETVSMHPLVIILLLIIGGEVAGFFGMILAVPMAVIIKIVHENINYYLF